MSIIKIYNSKISRDRNARVDSIQSYLATLTPTYECDNFQYQRLGIDLNVKLVLDQNKVGSAVGNYVDLYQDEKHFYFFINRAIWKSTSTVDLSLKLDTVNTFAEDFTFNKKTTIHRQHKNRGRRFELRGEGWYRNYEDTNFVKGWEYTLNPYYDETYCMLYYDYFESSHEEFIITKYNADGTILKFPGGFWFGFFDGDFIMRDDHEEEIFRVSISDVITDFNNGVYWTVQATKPYDYIECSEDYNLVSLTWYKRENLGTKFLLTPDKYPEGINPVMQYLQGSSQISDKGEDNLKWYLWYQSETSDENSAVGCWLYPSRPVTAKTLDTSGYIDVSDLVIGRYYYIMPKKLGSHLVQGGNIQTNGNADNLNFTGNTLSKLGKDFPFVKNFKGGSWIKINASAGFVIRTDDGQKIRIFSGGVGETSGFQYYVITEETPFHASISRIEFEGLTTNRLNYSYSDGDLVIGNPKTMNTLPGGYFDMTGRRGLTPTVSLPELPTTRTDSRIIKIIELPYCPVQYHYDEENNVYEFNGTQFLFDDTASSPIGTGHTYNTLKLQNTNLDFENTITLDFNPYEHLIVDMNPVIYKTDLRDDKFESKLFSSEFYQPTYVYDNFTYVVMDENLDLNVDLLGEHFITFKPSSNINSYLLFDFDYNPKYSDSPFSNILVCNRNNEVTIYSNAYVDYLKNGYNYDVKNKQANLGRGVAQTALSVGAGIASGALVGSSAGPIGIAIGAAVGLVGGLISTISSQVSAENAIQQKLNETSNQKTTNAGADDLDLFNYYCGNKLKYTIKSCSDKVKNMVADLFYYCGYADNIQDLPDTNSRIWFNFIQCDAVFNEESNTPYREYLEDLKARYAEGVTVYHRNEGTGDAKYDWYQQYENWESELFTPIN